MDSLIRSQTDNHITKPYVYSENIMKILEEIENEAIASSSKPKTAQKNHMKENFKRLKEIQARAKQKSAEKQSLQPLRAFNKYSQVQPKVSAIFNSSNSQKLQVGHSDKNGLPRTAGPYRTQPPLSPCLSSRSDCHSTSSHYGSLPQLNNSNESDEVSENSTSLKKVEENINSWHKMSHNHVCSKNRQDEPKSEAKLRLGRIPSYLTERKKQWELEREKQLKLLEESSIPPGHTLLPDEERIETLELLKKNQEELLQCLASVPVRSDTIRLRLYKEDLERQLAKIEEGIKIFSKPKVLIKNDP